MVEILSFICLLIAILGYYKHKLVFNPITSMFALWGIILTFSNMGLYSVNVPRDKFYIIIALGLLGYLIGVLFGSTKVKLRKEKLDNRKFNFEYCINYSLMNFLGIITLIYYFIQFLIVVRLLLSGYDYSYIRLLAVSQEENILRSSQLFVVLNNFIASPVTYLMIALLPIEIFFGKKKKFFILECIGVMMLFVLTTGGRSVILWIGLYFLCVFFIYLKYSGKKKFYISKKYKRIIFFGGILLFLFLFYMTKSRKGDDVDFLQQLFVYFVAPLPHADCFFDVVDHSGRFGYGVSSFYGLFYPLFFLFRLVGIFNDYPEFITQIRYMSFEMMETGSYIGGGLYMNAFVTVFYQPYLDGRYLGVFLILLIFGYMCGFFFKKAYYSFDVQAILIYILLLQKILFSFVRFFFTQQAQSIFFFLAFFVITKKIIDKRKKSITNDFCNYTSL